MMVFKRLNSLVGWICFAIAALTYLLTIEPTGSIWDCGEFIATGYKLEVGHPPGNPIFLLITRFFTMLAFGDVDLIPIMANAMSALCSALTILLLFWTITHLARKLVTAKGAELSLGNTIAIIGAGAIGALAYTFTDTFWFSAVEGEVYAMSSLCTAATFWVILKWEDRVGEPYANRWLILMAYIMGLAIGVHLLNLLTIPAVGMIYYYKMYQPSWKGGIVAFIISCFIVLVSMMMIPGIPTIASWFELLFVNVFGLPYNSGTVVGFLAIVVLLFWACYFTHKRGKALLNTIALFVTVIVVGYSAYALNIIRSAANPPINEAAPDNVFSFISYLNRDQYGSAPLLRGQNYSSDIVEYGQSMIYVKKDTLIKDVKKNGVMKKDTLYNVYDKIPTTTVKYDPSNQSFFPRLHSSSYIEDYIAWAKIRPSFYNSKQIPQLLDSRGQKAVKGDIKVLSANEAADYNLPQGEQYYRFAPPPTMGENLRYFFSYQFDWMYMRYFFWNFAGRQNDVQGHGGSMYGNWISGIKALDDARIPGLEDQPEFLKNNKANNKYYLIPLILGLIGLCYQLIKDSKQWFVVALLFFFTGIAIVLYLNQTPLQPRERDYAYAGSFYAYAIWIGFAVLAFYELLSNAFKKSKAVVTASVATLICLPAPILLAEQNWDDHDRSGRYIARDIAYNYLMSCDPNAILFTVGDNDTFPLWYLQEVEGVRTDVRVSNLSLLAADWYIDQMKYKTYESDPLPISLPRDSYLGEENMRVYLVEEPNTPTDLKWLIDFVANPKNKKKAAGEDLYFSYLPSKTLSLPVNKQNVLSNGLVRAEDADLIQDTITFSLPSSNIIKPQLIIYDILANNKWERPIHFTTTGGESNVGLRDYMQYNGFTYKLLPIKTASSPYEMVTGRIDTEWLYSYLMNTCEWRSMDDPNIYVDHFYETTLLRVINIRGMFSTLANRLINEGDVERAKLVLNKIMEIMPENNFPYCIGSYSNDMSMVAIVDGLYKVGEVDKAAILAAKLSDLLNENLMYFYAIEERTNIETYSTFYAMQSLYYTARDHGNIEVSKKLEAPLKSAGFIK